MDSKIAWHVTTQVGRWLNHFRDENGLDLAYFSSSKGGHEASTVVWKLIRFLALFPASLKDMSILELWDSVFDGDKRKSLPSACVPQIFKFKTKDESTRACVPSSYETFHMVTLMKVNWTHRKFSTHRKDRWKWIKMSIVSRPFYRSGRQERLIWESSAWRSFE